MKFKLASLCLLISAIGLVATVSADTVERPVEDEKQSACKALERNFSANFNAEENLKAPKPGTMVFVRKPPSRLAQGDPGDVFTSTATFKAWQQNFPNDPNWEPERGVSRGLHVSPVTESPDLAQGFSGSLPTDSFVIAVVYFEPGSARISPRSIQELKAASERAVGPIYAVSYTDTSGDQQTNEKISKQRMDAFRTVVESTLGGSFCDGQELANVGVAPVGQGASKEKWRRVSAVWKVEAAPPR